MGKRLAILLSLALVVGLLGAVPAVAKPADAALMPPFCSSVASIQGTGATFSFNAITKAFIPAYEAACPAAAGKVTYTGTGSGAGKSAICNRTVAFGGSDEPLTADEYLGFSTDTGSIVDNCAGHNVKGASPIHHIPLAVGAVTVSYNLKTLCGIGRGELNLRSPALALIYAGVITKWDHKLLKADNPALKTCHQPIKLVARGDSSGTTYVFKDYLSKRNPEYDVWKQPERNTDWPAVTLGIPIIRGTGNGGVAAAIKANPGAIGYVEYSTAKSNNLDWGKVDGATAQFSLPDPIACEKAAVGAAHPASTLLPGWDLVTFTDSANPGAYPICSVTYALVYNNLKKAYKATTGMTAAQAQTLVDFLATAVGPSGQSRLHAQGYGELPKTLATVANLAFLTLDYI